MSSTVCIGGWVGGWVDGWVGDSLTVLGLVEARPPLISEPVGEAIDSMSLPAGEERSSRVGGWVVEYTLTS